MYRTDALPKALVITKREIKDTFRDWRIIAPILVLTLVFPWLMNYAANIAADFVEEYDAAIVVTRLIPFLILVVGFFPISFSLVIALETFVGEKERGSLEPLLSMPITDGQLYLGKMLAALAPPLLASSLGICVYLGGLLLSIGYRPEPVFLLQVWLLTVVEALAMVNGAVIVSSQTASVRAANLLASFIILPMALLLQAEAVAFFWGGRTVLWVLLAGLLVVDVILIRTGAQIFNREELLGREVDQINLRGVWRSLRSFFIQGPVAAPSRNQRFSLQRVYVRDLPFLLGEARGAFLVVVVVVVGAMLLGWAYSGIYRLPLGVIDLKGVTLDTFTQPSNLSFMPRIRTESIFFHNVRALLLGAGLAPFSFGVSSAVLLSVPMTLVGWVVGVAPSFEVSPVLFFAVFLLPHAVFELPAAVLSTAFSVRIGACLMKPPHGLDVGQSLLMSIADYVKVFVFLVIPLLLCAAFVEANITPRLVVWAFSG